MDPSRSHSILHVINNCEGPRTKQILSFLFMCFDLPFIKLFINTREKQELPGVHSSTYGLIDFGCPTEL